MLTGLDEVPRALELYYTHIFPEGDVTYRSTSLTKAFEVVPCTLGVSYQPTVTLQDLLGLMLAGIVVQHQRKEYLSGVVFDCT